MAQTTKTIRYSQKIRFKLVFSSLNTKAVVSKSEQEINEKHTKHVIFKFTLFNLFTDLQTCVIV